MKRFYFLSLIILSLVFTSCDWYCCGGYIDHNLSQTKISSYGITVTTYVGKPDYYGGRNVSYNVINASGQTITDIDILVEMRDMYNERCWCEDCGAYQLNASFEGQFYDGNTYDLKGYRRFCNFNARRAHIKQCWVTFETGERIELMCGYYY